MVHDWDGAGGTVYPLMAPWIGLDHLRFGIVGMAASLVAMVVVDWDDQGTRRRDAGDGRRDPRPDRADDYPRPLTAARHPAGGE